MQRLFADVRRFRPVELFSARLRGFHTTSRTGFTHWTHSPWLILARRTLPIATLPASRTCAAGTLTEAPLSAPPLGKPTAASQGLFITGDRTPLTNRRSASCWKSSPPTTAGLLAHCWQQCFHSRSISIRRRIQYAGRDAEDVFVVSGSQLAEEIGADRTRTELAETISWLALNGNHNATSAGNSTSVNPKRVRSSTRQGIKRHRMVAFVLHDRA